ncbi:hypothetical protein ACLB1O_29860 [Escherichia coli]
MPKKVIYGDARLATDMDLSKSIPDKKSPYKHPPISGFGKMLEGKYKKQFIYRRTTIFNSLCPDTLRKEYGIVIPQLRKL